MHPFTPFIHLSTHHPSTLSHAICPNTGPLIHSCILKLPYSPNHSFFLSAICTSIHFHLTYLSASLHMHLSPIHINLPIHPPSTLLPLMCSHTTCLSIFNLPIHPLSIHRLATYPPIHPHATIQSTHHLPIHTSTDTSACLPTRCYLLTHPSIQLTIHLLPILLSTCLPTIHLHTTHQPLFQTRQRPHTSPLPFSYQDICTIPLTFPSSPFPSC